MSWTKDEDATLRRHLRNKSLFASEIAEMMGRSAASVRHRMCKLGVLPDQRVARSGRMAEWNAKHRHIRKKAMTYFLTHTAEETAKHFGLTAREFKSLQTVGYRDPALQHLRKDTRRHDVWSFDETMKLLRAAGLQPRVWIAKKLRRGGLHAVKEMVSRLNANTRYINGLPRRLAEELLGVEVEGFKVKAGPSGPVTDCRPIIVPWVVLHAEACRSSRLPDHLRDALRVMARFQKRIHGTRGVADTCDSIMRIIGGRL